MKLSNKTKRSSYEIWRNIKQRCLNPNRKDFKRYGGSGVLISEEWLYFDNFFKDMGERPALSQIDRMDNEKGYSKENCRWVTTTENLLNRRRKIGKKLSKGVSVNRNRFVARIQIDGFTYHIGSFFTEKEACLSFSLVRSEWYGKNILIGGE